MGGWPKLISRQTRVKLSWGWGVRGVHAHNPACVAVESRAALNSNGVPAILLSSADSRRECACCQAALNASAC